jgi:GDP-mannose 6-dehydrogenase
MKISVFGLGYVGCVTSACFASFGHQVLGVDVNIDKVNTINNHGSPIVERGLEKLIEIGVKSGNLCATNSAEDAVIHGEILLICVGTPSDINGNLNFIYVDRVCQEIACALKKVDTYKVIVFRSTLLPGILSERLIPLLEESGKKVNIDFGIVINPEFLREGSALDDFLNPPYTVLGQKDEHSGNLVEQLYGSISAPVFKTDTETACFIKYACNAFHGLKITFANEIGRICKQNGVDGTKVMEIFCQDNRLNISHQYLRPGFAFGGSCLPKDLRAIMYLARHGDLRLPTLESILISNKLHIQNTADKIMQTNLRKIGVLGLTFKPGTDDLRESPIVELIEILLGKGLQIRVFDENVNLARIIGKNKTYIESVIPHISKLLCTSIEKVIKNSEIIVVAHSIQGVYSGLFEYLKPNQFVFDFVKINSGKLGPLIKYEGICW